MTKDDIYRIYLSVIESIEEKDDDLDECDIVAGDSAGPSGMLSMAKGTTTGDVLGNHSHSEKGGFFGKDCFHIPKPVFKKPLKRAGKNGMIADAERKD